MIAGTSSLAQQLLPDATIAGIAAFAAQHAAQTALRLDHPFARRLLEQAPGEMLDLRLGAEARAVEQPQGNLQRQASGFGKGRSGGI